MKTVIVTGANGLIGNYLVNELSKCGHQIYAVVRNEKSDVSKLNKIPNTSIVYCNLEEICNLPQKIEVPEIDIFYHLAWDGSSGNLRKEYGLQLWNAGKACDAVKCASILKCKKFVGIGSVVEIVLRKNMLKDDFCPSPESFYGIAKITANYMCKSLCKQYGMEYNWVYIANLYGVGDRTHNLISYIIREYLLNKIPELTKGNQLADFIYVTDAARAISMIGESGKTGRSYYVGGNNIRPLKDFILIVRNLIDVRLESGLGRKEMNGKGVDYNDLDISLVKQDTGFIPEIEFEEGIRRTIAWKKKELSKNGK